jgi:hypothetical protein
MQPFRVYGRAIKASYMLCIEDWLQGGCCNALGLVFYALHRRLVAPIIKKCGIVRKDERRINLSPTL